MVRNYFYKNGTIDWNVKIIELYKAEKFSNKVICDGNEMIYN